MLGFDALGRLALGQASGGATTTFLTASAGSFAMTGTAASFTVKEAAAVGAFALTGVSLSFTVKEAPAAGAYGLAGVAVSFQVTENIGAGSFSINGYPVNEPVVENLAPGSFILTGYPANLVRTGDNYEFKLGGVGHYKLDLERAKQLARMERKVPPPLDLRTAPTFKAVGSPPIAPAQPAPDMAAIQSQQAQQAAAHVAARRKRDLEAILLLAS